LFKREWKGAQGLAEDVRYYGQWMRDEAERRIGHLYSDLISFFSEESGVTA
jgi:putative DNA methylase